MPADASAARTADAATAAGNTTQAMAADWTHGYSRELAVFPLQTLKRQKYWPPVARVDNVYGDKNVFCACIPMCEYAGEDGIGREPEAFSEPMAI